MGIFGLFKPNVQRLKRKQDINGLINALCYKNDTQVRKAAAIALGEMKRPEAIDPLMRAVDDIASPAIDALESIGAVEGLLAITKSSYRIMQGTRKGSTFWGRPSQASASQELIMRMAAGALCRIGLTQHNVIPSLIKDLVKMVPEEVIEVINKTTSVDVLIAIVRATGQWDFNVARAAAERLAELSDKSAIEPLKHALEHTGGTGCAEYYAKALERLGWSAKSENDPSYYLLLSRKLDELVKLGASAAQRLIDSLFYQQNMWFEERAMTLIRIGNPAIQLILKGFHALDQMVNLLLAVHIERNRSPRDDVFKAYGLAEKQAVFAFILGQIGSKESAEIIIDWLFRYPAFFAYWERRNYEKIHKTLGDALYGDGGYKPVLTNLFEGYTQLILDTSGYRWVENDAPGSDGCGTNYEFDFPRNDDAMKRLCDIQTGLSNNILYKIAHRKEVQVDWPRAPFFATESAASEEEIADKMGIVVNYFELQKKRAREELKSRGCPAYDPSAFLTEIAWGF